MSLNQLPVLLVSNGETNQKTQPEPELQLNEEYFNRSFDKIFNSYQNIEELKNLLNNSSNEAKKKFIKLLIDKIMENMNIPKKLKIIDLFLNFVLYKLKKEYGLGDLTFFNNRLSDIDIKEIRDVFDKKIKNIIYEYETEMLNFNTYINITPQKKNTQNLTFSRYIETILIYYLKMKEI